MDKGGRVTKADLIEALARRRWPFLWTDGAPDSFNDGARSIISEDDMPVIVAFVEKWIAEKDEELARTWRKEMS